MILGIGIDMVEIRRVESACSRDSFLSRCYSTDEQQHFRNSPASLAGNFAVKEAVAKGLGTGFRTFRPGDIEVLRDNLGKPYVNLYGNARLLADRMGAEKIHVSITHTDELASAYVIIEGREQNAATAAAVGGGHEISGKQSADEGNRQQNDPSDRDSLAGTDGAGGACRI